MSLIDDLAEQHIQKALDDGMFDHLPGAGKLLIIDDNSHIPTQLRMAYKLLKNSGFIPKELEQRKQALDILGLLEQIDENSKDYGVKVKELQLIELKMHLAGINTNFLKGRYSCLLGKKLAHKSDLLE